MYKDFTQVNEENKKLIASSPRADVVQRFINAITNRNSATKDIASSWARAYAGVQTVEYDSDGHVTDVTGDNAISTVDEILYQAKGNFQNMKDQADNLNDLFSLTGSQSSEITIPNAKQILSLLNFVDLDKLAHFNSQFIRVEVRGNQCNLAMAINIDDDVNNSAIFADMQNPVRIKYAVSASNASEASSSILDDSVSFLDSNDDPITIRSGLLLVTKYQAGTVPAVTVATSSINCMYTNTNGKLVVTRIHLGLYNTIGNKTAGFIWTDRLLDGWVTARGVPENVGWVSGGTYTDAVSASVASELYLSQMHSGSNQWPATTDGIPTDIPAYMTSDLYTLLDIPDGQDMIDALDDLL